MCHFSLIFSFFMMVITPLFATLNDDAANPYPPKITHIQFSPSPFGISDITVRLHLPGNNYVEIDIDHEGRLVKLEHPIETANEEANYHKGTPFSFIDRSKIEYEVKKNGEYQCALWTFLILTEDGGYEKGPLEYNFSGRLWPVDLESASVTSTLYFDIKYFGGSYKISSSFIDLVVFRRLGESLPSDGS